MGRKHNDTNYPITAAVAERAALQQGAGASRPLPTLTVWPTLAHAPPALVCEQLVGSEVPGPPSRTWPGLWSLEWRGGGTQKCRAWPLGHASSLQRAENTHLGAGR